MSYSKMYIDVKETIKKYFLVKMKEGCGGALSFESILNLKKSWKVGCYKWRPVGAFFITFHHSDAEFHPDW